MGRLFFSLFFCVLLLGMAGCKLDRRAEGFEVPDVPSRIVFGSFLGDNDTIIWVRVTASNPVRFNEWRRVERGLLGGTYFHSLRGAEVSLRNETLGTRATLQYDDSLHQFAARVSDFPIHAGHTYSVEASVSGFATARGSCTIPSGGAVPFSVRKNSQGDYEFFIKVPREPVRYFLVRNEPVNRAINHLVSEFVCSSNEGSNGVVSVVGFSYLPEADWRAFKLYEVDEHTYRYYTTSMSQHGMLAGFFTNPSLVYTNVQDGLGVVGGMRYLAETDLPR